MRFSIDVRMSGPVFDDRAAEYTREYCEHLTQVLSDDIETRIKIRLNEVLRDNHGIYVNYIHQESQDGGIVVTDRWIRYGPWLEGVGSRVGMPGTGTWPLTRFPGYHTFQHVYYEFEPTVHDRAEAELQPYIDRINS